MKLKLILALSALASLAAALNGFHENKTTQLRGGIAMKVRIFLALAALASLAAALNQAYWD